jgi:hypothetical protein
VTKSVTVDCTAGKVVVGGGFSIADSVDVVGSSFPVDSDTWQADAWEADQENGNWTVTVYAICADA